MDMCKGKQRKAMALIENSDDAKVPSFFAARQFHHNV
jgi:hypothetical protein